MYDLCRLLKCGKKAETLRIKKYLETDLVLNRELRRISENYYCDYFELFDNFYYDSNSCKFGELELVGLFRTAQLPVVVHLMMDGESLVLSFEGEQFSFEYDENQTALAEWLIDKVFRKHIINHIDDMLSKRLSRDRYQRSLEEDSYVTTFSYGESPVSYGYSSDVESTTSETYSDSNTTSHSYSHSSSHSSSCDSCSSSSSSSD